MVSRLKRQEAAIRRFITIGAVTTLVGGTLLVRHALGLSWSVPLLFGSLVIVTGPTVVAPLLRDLRLNPRLKTILEAEGVLIDPIGALVTTPAVATLAVGIGTIIGSVMISLVVGLLARGLLSLALRHRALVASGFETIVTLAFVVLLFELCEHVAETSGLLAVTVTGVVVGNIETHVNDEL